MRSRSAVLLAALVILPGCGHVARRPVPAAEWKAVIRDWVEDGRFDHDPSCVAIRRAITRLPADRYPSPLPISRAYARTIC